MTNALPGVAKVVKPRQYGLVRRCYRFNRALRILIAVAWMLMGGTVTVFAQTTAPSSQFGILYTGWHCLVTKTQGGRPFGVISESLQNKRPWAPIPEFHFWTEPRDGFYCLTERPDLLREHAELLRDAGIDFIVFDATNIEYADNRSPDARLSIMEPFERLLEIWSNIEGAPKVVAWAPLTTKGNMLEWMLGRLARYRELQFVYHGRPLVLVTQNALFPTDEGKARALSYEHTLRRMWGLSTPDIWSFLSVCQPGFLASQARIPCKQQRVLRDGHVEQISIAAAYQETYMSNKQTAVPKFGGRTFVRQFETAFEIRPEIAVISGWNEWMAQRFCLDARNDATHRGCRVDNDHWPDGRKIFVDLYDAEYNRDIEPSKDIPGDFYYRLMRHCILAFRRGERCLETDVN